MLPANRVATHPGVFIRENLEGLDVTQAALAAHTGMTAQRVNEIISGKRGVTAETAWLLSQAFGTTPEFWMNLQAAHDLTRKRPTAKITALKADGRSREHHR
jgi:addiction module HigA family antidote